MDRRAAVAAAAVANGMLVAKSTAVQRYANRKRKRKRKRMR
jgi:hypothetical protein